MLRQSSNQTRSGVSWVTVFLLVKIIICMDFHKIFYSLVVLTTWPCWIMSVRKNFNISTKQYCTRLNPVQYCTRLNPVQYCTRLNPVQYCTRLNPMQYCTRFPTLSSDKARHPCNCWQGQPELCQTLVWGKADKPCQVEQKALKEKREKILSHWVLKENWGSLRKFACTIYILYRKEKVHCTSIVPSKEVSKELGTGLNTKLKFQDQVDQSNIVSLTVLAGKATDLVKYV